MLTGKEIIERVKTGDITIENFTPDRINPNSYNLKLSPALRVYDIRSYTGDPTDIIPLDMRKDNPTKIIMIPEEGMVLQPGILYLGSTEEYTECKDLIPCIDGRSSIARLGICIHVTAGFGDIGFKGKWTLEITVVHPIRIYPHCEICQIYYEIPDGDTSIQYNGKYQDQRGPTASRMFMDPSANTCL